MNKQELIGHVADRAGLSRNDAARAVEILALGDVELGVPHPVADGAFVAECDGGDVVQRVALLDVPAGLADDQHQLALAEAGDVVVEARVALRPRLQLVVVVEHDLEARGRTSGVLWPTKERGVRMNMLGYFGASWPSLYSALRSG